MAPAWHDPVCWVSGHLLCVLCLHPASPHPYLSPPPCTQGLSKQPGDSLRRAIRRDSLMGGGSVTWGFPVSTWAAAPLTARAPGSAQGRIGLRVQERPFRPSPQL